MSANLRLPLAAAIAVLAVLLLGPGSAYAEPGLVFEPAGAMTATSLGALTFTSPVATISCALSLSGSLNASTTGFDGGVGGTISRATVSSCSGATVTTRTETPWTLLVGAKLGTLPILTGIGLGFYNADFLFEMNIFGLTARCEYLGHIGTLGSLTSSEHKFRVGLLSVSATDQRFIGYTELDTTGLCPRGGEVAVRGGMQINPNLIMPATWGMQVISPARPIIYLGTESRVITFRNQSTFSETLRRVRLLVGTQYAIEANTCLTPEGGAQTVLSAGTCTVTVRYTNPAGNRLARFDTLEIRGDPNDSVRGDAFLNFIP